MRSASIYVLPSAQESRHLQQNFFRVTGSLCLPLDIVSSLSVPFVGRGVAVLADGSTVETSYHRAGVLWHGREIAVQVLVTEGGPLVGMTLLRGSVLTMTVSPGGEVTVEEA